MTRKSLVLPLFLTGEALSMFGNASMMIVLPWLVLSRTGEPSVAGLVAGVAAAPAVLAALGGGWLIDRVGPQRMSVLSDVGSALCVAALALVDRLFGLDIGWFVLLGVLGALFDAPGMTARDTLTGRVCRTSGVTLDRLTAVRQGIFGVTFLAGPALAGVLLSVLDPIEVVWITAACSAVAAVCTAALRLVPAQPDEGPDQEIGGLQTIRRSPALRGLFVIAIGGALLTTPIVAILLPAHFRSLGQPDLFGYTMSAFAVGSLVGAGLYAALSARSRGLAFRLGILLSTLGLGGVSVLDGFWVVAVGTLTLGIGSGVMSPIFLVLITDEVREAVRGRVLGMMDAVTLLAAPLGLLGLAWLLTGASLQTAAVVVLCWWLVVAAYSMMNRGIRDYLARHPTAEPDDNAHEEVLAGAHD